MTDAELAAIEAREERAFDELMRVTGMGKYAENVRGGPPQPRRASIPARPDYDTDLVIGASLRDRTALVAEVRRLRAREAALEEVVALAECGPPMHRYPVAPPIIGFEEDDGVPIYPPGYDPTKHADDCTGCKFNDARAALAALDAKEKP